jgi:hypothetical protein
MKYQGPSLGILACLACLACASRTSPQPSATAPLPSRNEAASQAVAAPLVVDAPRGPIALATPAFTPFGRVVGMDEQRALWRLPAPPRAAPAAPAARYERWHERRRANLGYGYLTIVDLSGDERSLLVVSEDEAKLRLYDFPSLHLVSNAPVEGYHQFARGDFVFGPPTGARPGVVFAGEQGLVLLDAGAAAGAALSDMAADALRWTDDHAVLGAAAAFIPAQRSRLVFYVFSAAGALEPVLVLSFAERVEEWDLDSSKRRLAVTYYPSNQTELLDLAERKVLWVAPAPEYANSVDISPDDSRLAVGGSSLVLHDMGAGEAIARDAHFGNNIHRVRFSPSGDAIAVSSYEGKLRIFDARAAGPTIPLRKLLRHSGTANVYALSFTHDGSALVSGSGDRTIRVWGE